MKTLTTVNKFIDNCDFRYEVYFNLQGGRAFGIAKTAIKKLPTDFKLVFVSKDILKTYVSGVNQNLNDVFEQAKCTKQFEWVFLFLYLYGLFLTSVKSSSKITKPFIEKNVGYGIPQNCINLEDVSITLEFFRHISGPQFWALLLNVFGKTNSSYDERLFFSLRAFWNAPISLTPEFTQHFVTKIRRFFMIKAEKCRANSEHPKEFVVPGKFFDCFANKYSKNLYIVKIVHMIKNFSGRSDECYFKICSSLIDYRIYFYFNSAVYYVKSFNEGFKVPVLSIESIQNIVRDNEFIVILRLFSNDYKFKDDDLVVKNIIEEISREFSTHFNIFKRKHSLELPQIQADQDFFLRLLFAKVPSEPDGTEYCDLESIVNLFKNINDYFFYISCGVLMGFCPNNMPLSLRQNVTITIQIFYRLRQDTHGL